LILINDATAKLLFLHVLLQQTFDANRTYSYNPHNKIHAGQIEEDSAVAQKSMQLFEMG